VSENLFKEMQKIHNNILHNNKNNFIVGSTSALDAKKIKTETLSIKLLPHQIFVCPRAYVVHLKNADNLQQEHGVAFYQDSVLRHVF
jgi:hypothetical protein